MAGFNPPTELELRNKVADLILLFAEDDRDRKVEAAILAMGRFEMQHLLAFLLVRYLETSLKLQRLQQLEGINDQSQHSS
jgi:hypothetical protein